MATKKQQVDALLDKRKRYCDMTVAELKLIKDHAHTKLAEFARIELQRRANS